MNAKTDSIIISAQQDFISLTNRDTILDTGQDFVIGGKEIHLLDNTTQAPADKHVAIAEAVVEAFEKLINALIMGGAYTATGPVVAATGIIANLESVSFKLDGIKSELVKIQK